MRGLTYSAAGWAWRPGPDALRTSPALKNGLLFVSRLYLPKKILDLSIYFHAKKNAVYL